MARVLHSRFMQLAVIVLEALWASRLAQVGGLCCPACAGHHSSQTCLALLLSNSGSSLPCQFAFSKRAWYLDLIIRLPA